MATQAANRSFQAAKVAKEDEFYTQLSDIEHELRHYRKHFKDKVVYCNCDDPRVSNFFHYFSHNFEKLGLKKLIATCYKNQDIDLFSQGNAEEAVYLEYDGDKDGDRLPGRDEIVVHQLAGDGDFRSNESIELLKQADIVVTNPPFSLFREYMSQLIEHDKKFVILANQNALTTKDIFEPLQQGRFWLGYNNGDMAFRVPNHYEPRSTRFWVDDEGQKWRSFGTMCWLTNLDIAKRHEDLILYKNYSPEAYPAYDNFDAIDVNAYKEIPMDYDGVMGVPLGFLTKHNPEQFEIVGITTSYGGMQSKRYPKQIQVGVDGSTKEVGKLNDAPAMKVSSPPAGKPHYRIGDELFVLKYHRILIRRKAGS
ncbi:adenine-specific methyltransferase EcoRI family protein [Mycolicibacterium sp.]|uniref:adenine-specific methyltransferase EcoRI family protein n=1 Tax=Mycolicibacterium sp. TaxID=2320850 RepID=UPI0037C6220E